MTAPRPHTLSGQQYSDQIGNPGGYLRALARKGEAGAFSPGPTVLALIKAEPARAA